MGGEWAAYRLDDDREKISIFNKKHNRAHAKQGRKKYIKGLNLFLFPKAPQNIHFHDLLSKVVYCRMYVSVKNHSWDNLQ